MEPADISSFTGLLSNVYAFYRQDVSKFAINVWIESMRPFSFTAVSDALNRHLMNPDSGQFLPKPADIVKMLQGSTKDSALIAWSEVDKKVRSTGPYMSPTFDDPIIASVILDMGGWIQLNLKTDDEWPFVSNEFVTRYRGFKMRNDFPANPPQLMGISDHQNKLTGQVIAQLESEEAKRLIDRSEQ